MRAATTVLAIGEKMRPSTRCSMKMGRYAAMMMRSANTVGRTTDFVALSMRSSTDSAASYGRLLASATRMLSMMTTPPSTMTPKSTAPMESRFADRPRSFR